MNDSDLALKLKHGPSVLLLGQAYLRQETGIDPFLQGTIEKYASKKSDMAAGYNCILDSEARTSPDASLAWMSQYSSKIPSPESMSVVAGVAWNAIFTSAIDTIWPRSFRNDWRELHPIILEKFTPADPRNRFRLHCTFLFGRIDRTEPDEKPPLSELDFLSRNQSAISMVRRIPDTVSPFGVLVIEGYSAENDWLGFRDLLPIIRKLGVEQTHIFSADSFLASHPFVSPLAESHKLVLHSEHLDQFLVRAEQSGFIKLGEKPTDTEGGNIVIINDVVHTVPPSIRNLVVRSAIILDDTLFGDTTPVSPDKEYAEFRMFLSTSGTKPLWAGYAKGFAFRRTFENELVKIVEEELQNRNLQKSPIVLHGQTGTGKTIALGSLAFRIRKAKKYPVLFIERRTQRPLPQDIDAFCKWAEDEGALSTLVIWDGMLPVDAYYDLLNYLVGRGRKCVILCTCYRTNPRDYKDVRFVEASAALNDEEKKTFLTFMGRFDKAFEGYFTRFLELHDDSFLVALYRLLPYSRALIRAGLQTEYGVAESTLTKLLKSRQTMPFVTALGVALEQAGIIQTALLEGDTGENSEESFKLKELTALVMVPGRFGLNVPVELLLRSSGQDVSTEIISLLNSVDIFRWPEDGVGNITIGARHPLEAKLVVQARLGGARTEVNYACKLIREIQPGGSLQDSGEIQFAVELVRYMGPNETDSLYYKPFFGDFVSALRELRLERGVRNVRLMLQEATLIREICREPDFQARSAKECREMLGQAEDILRKGLELISDDKRWFGIKSKYLVELASTLGTRITSQLGSSWPESPFNDLYVEARRLLIQAHAIDPENHYYIDAHAWISRNLLASGRLSAEDKANVEADILHELDIAESDIFSSVPTDRFHERKMEIAQVLDRDDLTQSSFETLCERGSAAGYYLKAKKLAGESIYSETVANAFDEEAAVSAINFLEQHEARIGNDARCNYLRLRIWFQTRAKKKMFYGERQCLPFVDKDWQMLLKLTLALLSTEDMRENPSLKYLQGVALFHIGDYGAAIEVFNELQRQSDSLRGKRRIIRSYLASNPDGTPRRYDGTVAWIDAGRNRGGIQVEQIGRVVGFLPRDFNRPEIQQHETLSGFHIAFNFLGLVADPQSLHRKREE